MYVYVIGFILKLGFHVSGQFIIAVTHVTIYSIFFTVFEDRAQKELSLEIWGFCKDTSLIQVNRMSKTGLTDML